tara:strand:- start:189 stop:476 length:288 start_codon:yes stop_codon:yes gene_type:complete
MSRCPRWWDHYASEGMGVFANEREQALLMEKFKPGDLVRIKDGTHQDGMPDHRVGMIVELGETSKSYTKAYTVVFLGTDVHLKFHEMFLEHFTSS